MRPGVYTDRNGERVKVTATSTGHRLTYSDGRTVLIGGSR